MSDPRRDECANTQCRHGKASHFQTNEKVLHVDTNGINSYEHLRAACMADFCRCEQFEQQ